MKKLLQIFITLFLIFIFFIYFSIDINKQNKIKSIKIFINKNDNKEYLKKIIFNQLNSLDLKIGNDINKADFFKIKTILSKNRIIKEIFVYKSLFNNLYISIKGRRPLARIYYNNEDNYYIDENGNLFPPSQKYQFRTIIILSELDLQLKNKIGDYESKLLKLLLYIDRDNFLRTLISKININKKGNINIFTQISKQKIEFGKPDNLELKFNKFKNLFKKTLPKIGWNRYKTINIEFDKQLVCK